MIERAPKGLPRIKKYRKEAIARIAQWLRDGDTPEEIIRDGYKWRAWCRDTERGEKHGQAWAWDWAVWEQIQLLAQKHGYEYKDNLTEEDIFNDPFLPEPTSVLCDGPRQRAYQRADYTADNQLTDYRNHNRARVLVKFLRSDDGLLWKRMVLRDLWRRVIRNQGKRIKGYTLGATRHFKEYAPFPGMQKLREATTWEEAMATEVTVYRGVYGEDENPGKNPVLSYTTSPQLARLFAEGYLHSSNNPGKGRVFKRTVLFGDLLGFYDTDSEHEVFLGPRGRSG